MKTIISILILSCVLAFSVNAQEDEKVRKKGDIFFEVDVMPEYPGGKEGVKTFIMENVKYPEKAKKNKISGKVFVQFIVDENGEVTNAKVIRAVSPELDEEALRVINSMEKWTPGKEKGKPVKVQFTVPIQFALS